MSFNLLDKKIQDWAIGRNIKLLVEESENKRLYFYVSSERGETFQIVIEPERQGAVRVDAHLIESFGDEEAHFIWELPAPHIGYALDLALQSVGIWLKRSAR